MMRKFYLSFLRVGLVLVLTGCGATHQLTLNTMEPAPVMLPTTIKEIGIINRSTPPEGTENTDRIDQILSAEDRWLAEKGTDAAITGLFDELVQDNRFDRVQLLDNVPEAMMDFGVLPDAISWNTIESLCNAYEVDAIFSLAFYDTDTQVSLKKAKVEQRNLVREMVNVAGHEITLETLIENGWRIYDPYNKLVIDEFIFNDQIVLTAKGVDPFRALQAIDDRKGAVLQKSKSRGSSYGLRLKPYEKIISRDYFVKGTENFVIAQSRAEMGDWQGAAELWEREVAHPKAKIRGRACHNMAVINEFHGELEIAMEWASKSYDNHKNKSALEYIEALKHRIAQNDLLQQQLAYNELSE